MLIRRAGRSRRSGPRYGPVAARRALATTLLALLACALASSPAQAAGMTSDPGAAPAGVFVAPAGTPPALVSAPVARVTTVPVPPPAASAGAAPSTTASGPDTDSAQPGRRPVAARCTLRVAGGQLPAVKPGDTVCVTGTLSRRLTITQGGTAAEPVTYSGMGTATVPGITARGTNIILEGFVSRGAQDNGFYASGTNITIRDNDISQVSITDDDVDAIRFFGDHITIVHNTAHDIWANPQEDRHPHTDCMQTYARAEPASSNVTIDANTCSSPQFHQCLMAEGPRDLEDGASGVGTSANWLVTRNVFDCHAEAQTVALQDIHNVTFSANDFAGTGDKAIALQKDAPGPR
jgi:hypothetical protein